MSAAPPLDEQIPQGDPEAVYCRWCHTGRVHGPAGGGLICIACDTNPKPKASGS